MKKSLARLISLKHADYKYRSKIKAIKFELTREEFIVLTTGDCAYCGLSAGDGLNSIDRVDNNKGYVLSNCVSACNECNRWKSSMELKEFVLLARAIYEKSLKKKD